MGKTTAAVRICQALSSTNCVVALDSTGEYRGRLGVAHPHPPQLDENGFWVNEMAGDLPIEARKFITEVMRLGVDDYEASGSQRRVVVLEEAHSFIPEWNIATRDQQAAAAFSNRLILQARKFGIRFVIVSQRSAIVSKSALTQCENYIILRTIDETGLDFLETVVGGVVRRAIPRLGRFEAVCVGPAFNSDSAVVVRLDPSSPAVAN
jgi:DNA helicase HerA-like ATPase